MAILHAMTRKYTSLAVLIRLSFVLIGIALDTLSSSSNSSFPPYTDIDYSVYTRASFEIRLQPTLGGSPYAVPTYRYSPLLAILLLPNRYFLSFGKIIFSIADASIASYLHTILLKFCACSLDYCERVSFLWAVNPVTIIIATRGSSDAITNLLLLIVILKLFEKKYLFSGLLFGLLVHLRLFPVIYTPAILLFILRSKPKSAAEPPRKIVHSSFLHSIQHEYDWIPAISFAISSLLFFALLSVLSWAAYGPAYLENALLYHVTRCRSTLNFILIITLK